MNTPSLVFLGSDAIALPMLDWIMGRGAQTARITAVFTQPDRATGRGQRVTPNAIKNWALCHGLPVHQPEKLTSESLALLLSIAPDAALVMAYGHILRDDFIGVPRLGTLNLHASILPRYRGASPIQAAIASGDRTSGVSLMRIVRELDAGPVADIERVPIAPLDTARELETRIGSACVPLLERTLPRLFDGTLTFVAQDNSQASYCRRLRKNDGDLDFALPAQVLAARIHALNPWPGCGFEYQSERIRIGSAEALQSSTTQGNPAGTVLASGTGGLQVASGQGVLRLLQLQRPGGRMLPTDQFLRGHPIPEGTLLASRPMLDFVSRTPFQRGAR